MKYAASWLFLTTILLAGCGQPQKSETIVARAGDEVLTLQQARAAIDTTNDSFDHQLNKYVAAWVTNSLLYQEAKRNGIDRSDQFKRDAAEAERQLTVQRFLQQQLFADSSQVSETQLQEYFQHHQSEFFLREDMMRLNLIGFATRELASRFAADVSRGASWDEALAKLSADSAAAGAVVSAASNDYYSQRTLYPPELWKVAATLATNEVSFPVKTALGYFVVQSTASVQQGKPAPFDLARREIRDRLLIELKRHRYDDLLGTLRKRYVVETMQPLSTPADSARIKTNE